MRDLEKIAFLSLQTPDQLGVESITEFCTRSSNSWAVRALYFWAAPGHCPFSPHRRRLRRRYLHDNVSDSAEGNRGQGISSAGPAPPVPVSRLTRPWGCTSFLVTLALTSPAPPCLLGMLPSRRGSVSPRHCVWPTSASSTICLVFIPHGAGGCEL